MTIGAGQHIWLQLWGGESGEEVIGDGVLEPGCNIDFFFTEPQIVTRVALTRITHEDADQLVAEKGVKQAL